MLKNALEAVAHGYIDAIEVEFTIQEVTDTLASTDGGHRQPLVPSHANTLGGNSTGGHRQDLDTSGAFIPEISGTVSSKWHKGTGGPAGDEAYNLVGVPEIANTLTKEGASGYDASEDGTGRTTLIAFSCKDSGQDAGDVAPTLRAMNHDQTWMNGGGQVAVAFQHNQDLTAHEDAAPSVTSSKGGVPAVTYRKSRRASSSTDAETWVEDDVANTLSAFDNTGEVRATQLVAYQCQGTNVGEMGTLRAGDGGVTSGVPFVVPFSIMPMNSGKDYKARQTDIAQPVVTNGNQSGNQGGDYIVEQPAVAFSMRGREEGNVPEIEPEDVSPTIRGASGGSTSPHIATTIRVRRLTPRECERLQGFPDDHTLVPVGKKMMSDTQRYKQAGNAVCVNVAQWIARRIQETWDGDSMEVNRGEDVALTDHHLQRVGE